MIGRMIGWARTHFATAVAVAFGVLLTATPGSAQVLQGDCDHDGIVSQTEAGTCVQIFLGVQPLSACMACDRNNDGKVSIGELVGAGNCSTTPGGAGCRMVVGVATATPTNTVLVATSTPTNTLPGATNTPTNTLPMATNTPTNTLPVATNTPTNTLPVATNTPTNTLPVATNTPTNTLPVATNTPTNTLPVATGTPTNTVPVATSTPTNTLPIATSTATNTAPVPTSTQTTTPTTMTSGALHLGVVPGGGSAGSCRGTCTAGINAGQPCGVSDDCPGGGCGAPKKCLGGPYDGKTCLQPAQCSGCDPNRICTAAGTPVACCTGANMGTCPLQGSCAIIQAAFPIRVPLNGVCLPRNFPPGDVGCTTNTECHTCVGGDNPGNTCAKASDCPNGSCGASGSGTCQLAALDLALGSQDANHEIPLLIPKSSLLLNPAIVQGIGAVCVNAGGNGVGVIDCDGGRANLNISLSRDHNTNMAKVCVSGSNLGHTCTVNSNCPGSTCANGDSGSTSTTCTAGVSGNGLPEDPTCTCSVMQPDGSFSHACLEGTKQCSGGTNDGTLCMMSSDCTGGGTCSFCNIGTNGGPHQGVCNSPLHAVLTGTFGPGDTQVVLPLAITVLPAPAATPPADYGPDHLPCTADDTVPPAGTVPVALSTGTNSIFVYDAGNVAGNNITPTSLCSGAPCVARITGKSVSCAALSAGNVAGVQFGGGFPAVDTTAGDIATVFQFALTNPTP